MQQAANQAQYALHQVQNIIQNIGVAASQSEHAAYAVSRLFI